MYFKLALKNMHKSLKDYAIYFITLSLAVCIFYSFNAMDSQDVMAAFKSSSSSYVNSLIKIISYISVFVSVILGCLILYANNFLIRRRNKELAIYMTLGMSKIKISKILIFETLIAGVLSLVGGLISGFIVSQIFSRLVLNFFKAKLDKYIFVISFGAVGKTIFYFGIIFLIVMLFNVVLISKYKIIDLLYMGRKNEKVIFNKPFVYVTAFIFSIIALSFSYKMALTNHLDFESLIVLKIIISGAIGIILFFYSLSGIILYIVKKDKRIYFKNLNIFLLNQINSKIKTNFISMSVISIMLFITIVSLSYGIAMKNSMDINVKECTPYDSSGHVYMIDGKTKDIKDVMKELGITNDLGEEYSFLNMYLDDIPVKDYIDSEGKVIFIKESEYNEGRKIRNEKSIDLKDNEVFIVTSLSEEEEKINNFIKENDIIKIKDRIYKIKNPKVVKENLSTDITQDNYFTVIINDEFCEDLNKIGSNINIEYPASKREECEEKYHKLYEEYKYGTENDDETIKVFTKQIEYERNLEITGTFLIVLIYLGLVFLITSMAVLAIHVLCEINDSFERYIILKKIGVNEKRINNNIFRQNLIYFSLPVLMAVVNSIVGIKVCCTSVSIYSNVDIKKAAFLAMIVLLIVYALYFIASYIGCKNIVKSKVKDEF